MNSGSRQPGLKKTLPAYALVAILLPLPAAFAQEAMDEASDSETEASDSETEESDSGTELENFEKLKDKADESRIAEAAEENSTGTDPRDFSLKWMPYYRYTELENGLVQQDLTAFGTVPFSPTLGMFYEVPVAQYRDFSDVPGSLRTDGIGLGDIDLKFLWNPKAMRFSYGNGMSGSVLLGTDFILPTATNDALGGNALLAAPIVGLVLDMPLHGFFAALNLYFFDVYKEDAAPKTSRYVGRFFYMQPLTPPGPWWGGFFLLPEFQPIYDFETDDFSAWIGTELGKLLSPGKIAYVKPGWGIDNSEPVDRVFTLEVGFRWFF